MPVAEAIPSSPF